MASAYPLDPSLNKNSNEVQQIEHSMTAVSDEDLLGSKWYSKQRFWNKQPLDGFYVEALNKYPDEESIDPFEEKKLVRKIDWIILPWCVALKADLVRGPYLTHSTVWLFATHSTYVTPIPMRRFTC